MVRRKASKGEGIVYWELPDGSRAIEITATPAVLCNECDMVYQPDTVLLYADGFSILAKRIFSS